MFSIGERIRFRAAGGVFEGTIIKKTAPSVLQRESHYLIAAEGQRYDVPEHAVILQTPTAEEDCAINSSMCTIEEDGVTFITEASDIGLKPGRWPKEIQLISNAPGMPQGSYIFSNPVQVFDKIIYTCGGTQFRLKVIND